MQRLQCGDYLIRQCLVGNHHKINVAALRVEVAARERAVQIHAHEVIAERGLNACKQQMQHGVDIGVGRGVIHHNSLELSSMRVN